MDRYILAHYSEIGLKKSNKPYFVKKLIANIKEKLEKKFSQTFKVQEVLSRIVIPLDCDFVEEEYVNVLKKIFGLKNFQFVYEGSKELKELGPQICANLPEEMKQLADKGRSFRVRVKKSQKLAVTSVEMERELGAVLLRNGIGMSVQMKHPNFDVNVEIFNNKSFYSYKKYQGLGGMSACTGDRLIAMISAGIDSPVAAFRMMRRGARVVFLHFHAYPFTDESEITNVKKLVSLLSDYQTQTVLYLCPFGEIQKQIATNLDIPPKIRVVLYRRMMIRVSERVAKIKKCKGVITGDSYAQVASQTAQNLFAIHQASSIPLFQPLISFDKDEIINVANQIGTFDVSKLPCKDTCSMFMPEHPELSANVYDLEKLEKNLPIDDWIDDLIANLEKVEY